jgi:CRISPR/Cas system-associated exonuclease Cas4 (RecB family)
MVSKRQERGATGYIVRASELNSYEYCHRSWWLRMVARVEPPPETAARFEAGTRRHAAHGRGLWLAKVARRAGFALLALGALLGGLWWVLSTLH